MQYVLSVSQINRYIREVISKDLILSNLWVKGEISNYKPHYSGHMYFTVKDENSLLKCVMFRAQASKLKFVPENGMKVIIRGYVSVFERDGQYQLYADEMQPDGMGNLHLAFEQLKRKLQEEGLFEQKYKKKLPYLPSRIGVVTSPTGAVIRDIINIVNRRFKNIELKIYAVPVQGELASSNIAKAIRKLNEKKFVDVIIVARGGGSLEELWAFNEEVVARSIFESEIPVISAVGHETDYTICDFVADVRAPTPSAAAELVVPEKNMLEGTLANLNSRLKNALVKNLAQKADKYKQLANSTAFRQPFNRVYQDRMRLEVLEKYLLKGMRAKKERVDSRLCLLAGKLDALSPLTILSRGYSVVKNETSGKLLKSVSGVKIDDILEITVRDGKINCIAKEIKGENVYGKE